MRFEDISGRPLTEAEEERLLGKSDIWKVGFYDHGIKVRTGTFRSFAAACKMIELWIVDDAYEARITVHPDRRKGREDDEIPDTPTG